LNLIPSLIYPRPDAAVLYSVMVSRVRLRPDAQALCTSILVGFADRRQINGHTVAHRAESFLGNDAATDVHIWILRPISGQLVSHAAAKRLRILVNYIHDAPQPTFASGDRLFGPHVLRGDPGRLPLFQAGWCIDLIGLMAVLRPYGLYQGGGQSHSARGPDQRLRHCSSLPAKESVRCMVVSSRPGWSLRRIGRCNSAPLKASHR